MVESFQTKTRMFIMTASVSSESVNIYSKVM